MIDLYKLHIFDAVVQTGNFSAAAEQLYITQSAVSQHMKDLETSLGQQLFSRGRRGVSLTSQGEILAGFSREIFALVAKAEAALTDVAQLMGGKISIGATPGVGVYLVPDWVQRFRAQYPRLTVALHTGVTSQIVADVLAHRLDFGIVEGELNDQHVSRLSFQVLEEIEQLVVVGFKHPFWDADTVQLDDLDQQSFIMRQPGSQSRIWLEGELAAHGITPMIGAEFDNVESMKRGVALGRCVAILPAYAVQYEIEQNQLRARSIVGKPLKRTLKLIWDVKKQFSPIARAFLDVLSKRFPGLESVSNG